MDIEKETGKKIDSPSVKRVKRSAALGAKQSEVPEQCSTEGLYIVILERGFVYVGDVTISGNWLVISNAQNVRRWGTVQGLGELALKGPQSETKLDMGGTIKAPLSSLIGLIKCEVSKWSS